MYLTQEVDYVVAYVDKEHRDNGVKIFVLWEHFQKVALDEPDAFVGPVVWHGQRRVSRGGVSLVRPFCHERLQDVLVQ